ncbi:MAG TPA: adenylate/guanylate cyclase domain-containing protein [Vicinamibacterales bacterium]|nr:adenylate/guanylate cyclase domain-containing protein [Vicinamibacterales bacterium]
MALTKDDAKKVVDDFFSGKYTVTDTEKIPSVEDLTFGKNGKKIELAMLFIDIRESTAIVDATRRVTAARMYKTFLWGVTKIARENDGEICSFNGDGVLAAFAGGMKRTNAAKAALQMRWFGTELLKPKMDEYFEENTQLQGKEFDFGIGIDSGDVLVVRGGIRGENNNDLVWVANATNYAVKLSKEGSSPYYVCISERVYDNMKDSSKYGGSNNQNMWTKSYSAETGETVYKSSWHWALPDKK